SRGFGFVDPVAAMKAAGRLKPEGLRAAAYGDEYFGPGPDAPDSDDDTSAWAAPLAGGAGGVLVVAAVVLWRGRREHPDAL
ncbi:type VII secretion-associated serine protease mycosin, partial [Streptomyces sp. NPDC059409]